MPTCSFCGRTLRPGTGEMYAQTDGRIHYFDSLKCKTYLLKHGKVARKFKWTKAFHLAKGAQPQAAKQAEESTTPSKPI